MKILEEMKEINIAAKDDKKWDSFGKQELDRQVYLHAALCEALRLYPVVAFDPRTATGEDTLPSGHHIGRNTKIIIFIYAMGRMEEIWGEDCLQYKPERWISEQGGIISVPSYKFSAFGGGPRNYHVQVVEGHPVLPSVSVVLHLKHGLKVRITKRSF